MYVTNRGHTAHIPPLIEMNKEKKREEEQRTEKSNRGRGKAWG